jgi:dienelactone hydrolase
MRRLIAALTTILVITMATPVAAADAAESPTPELSTDGQAAATAQPQVESYDIGEATIVQADRPADDRFREMPVRLQGVLAVPDGEGPFPVALIVHGAYQFCSTVIVEVDVYPCPPEDDLRQYEGFSYLAEALAERGYIAVVPDLSAEFNNGYAFPTFGERTVQIIEAHLNALEAGEGFEVDVAGKADLSRLVIAGHSRGGPLAVHYISDDAAATRTVSALALLTPAALGRKTKFPATMPTALVIVQCDGDVGTKGPLQVRNRQLKPLRKTLTAYYTIPGGTHNGFSTQLGSDPSKPCKEAKLLAPAEQQEWASRFVPDFFDMAHSSGRVPVDQ